MIHRNPRVDWPTPETPSDSLTRSWVEGGRNLDPMQPRLLALLLVRGAEQFASGEPRARSE